MSIPEPVNLAAKLAGITEYWRPRVVGELNGQAVKLVKLRGEFVWHHHDAEDELFLEETALLLFEPLGVLNTGNVTHPTLTAPVDLRG